MDGVTAQSLRQKGCRSGVVWGASLQHLRSLADRYRPDAELAETLWQSDVRECKILATMLMPAGEIDVSTARRWLNEAADQETVELLVFNLLQHVSFAPALAAQALDSEQFLPRLAALNLFARLFMRGAISCESVSINMQNDGGNNRRTESDGVPDADSAAKFVEKAVESLNVGSPALQRAAMNALVRFAETSPSARVLALAATQAAGFDFL